jgi:predicted anti-sigma-YlaC factor YlaD
VELSGDDAAAKMPQLKQHLTQCGTCRQEYETLRDLARLEKDDQLPSIDDLKDSLS